MIGCNACVETCLDAPDDEVRWTALEAAVLLGFRGAVDRFRAAVRNAAASAPPEVLERLGLLGGPDDLKILSVALESPELAPAALRGLGWLGQSGAAEPLLTKMADKKVARLAGHSFSTIFGADLEAAKLTARPPAEEASAPGAAEDNEESLDLDLYEGLPSPDPAAVTSWWKANAARFARGTRWRAGQPFSPTAPAATLRAGRLADRPAAALDLAVQVKEIPLLETRDLASNQRRFIDRHLATRFPIDDVARPGAPVVTNGAPAGRDRPGAVPARARPAQDGARRTP